MLLLGTPKPLLFKQLGCLHIACLNFSGLSAISSAFFYASLFAVSVFSHRRFLIKPCISENKNSDGYFFLLSAIRLTWLFVFLMHWKWRLSLFVSLFKKQPIPLLQRTRFASFPPLGLKILLIGSLSLMWQFIPKANVVRYCFSKVSFSNSFVVMYIFLFFVILVSLMTGKVLFLYLLRCIFNIYIYPVSAIKNSVRQVFMKGNIVEGSTYMRMERLRLNFYLFLISNQNTIKSVIPSKKHCSQKNLSLLNTLSSERNAIITNKNIVERSNIEQRSLARGPPKLVFAHSSHSNWI